MQIIPLPNFWSAQEGAQKWVDAKRSLPLQVDSVRMGFHSLPSLQQLHLHVISQVGKILATNCQEKSAIRSMHWTGSRAKDASYKLSCIPCYSQGLELACELEVKSMLQEVLRSLWLRYTKQFWSAGFRVKLAEDQEALQLFYNCLLYGY